MPRNRHLTTCCVLWTLLLLTLSGQFVSAQQAVEQTAPAEADSGVQFDLEALSKVPEVFPTEIGAAEGVKSFFYAGLPFKGKPTRVFAYYGVPEPPAGAEQPTQKLPAMVLIHGGGGTAFDRWVKLWNSRGYAAIAMDLCGCVPVGTYGKWQRHEQGGPPGWDASFNQLDDAVEDQWDLSGRQRSRFGA